MIIPMGQKGFAHLLVILLLLAGLVVSVYLVQTKTNLFPKASGPDKSSLIGKSLVVAYKYKIKEGTAANENLYLGHYDFKPNSEVELSYFSYDAKKNRNPNPTNKTHNPMSPPAPSPKNNCTPGQIVIPSYEGFGNLKGTWSIEGDAIKITLNSVIHEWKLEDANEKFYRMSRPLYGAIQGEISEQVGVGYISDAVRINRKLTKNDFLTSVYNGEITSNLPYGSTDPINTSWSSLTPTTWDFNVFKSAGDPSNLSYVNACPYEGHPNSWCESSLLLNYAPYSNLMMYYNYGHDFDEDYCYRDTGHATHILGIMEGDKITKMVFVGYSWSSESWNYPLLDIGRYWGDTSFLRPTPIPTSVPQRADPIALWKMDESSGNAIADSFGRYNLSSTGVTIVEGVSGKARQFKGASSDYITIGYGPNSPLRQPRAITYSAWVNIPAGGGGWVAGAGTGGGHGYGGLHVTDSGIQFTWEPVNLGREKQISSSSTISSNAWHHIVVSMDFANKAADIYLDGEKQTISVSTDATDWTPVAGFDNFRDYIGARVVNNNYSFFKGSLDEVGIWNRPLSASEVSALFQKIKPVPVSTPNVTPAPGNSAIIVSPFITALPASSSSTSMTVSWSTLGTIISNGVIRQYKAGAANTDWQGYEYTGSCYSTPTPTTTESGSCAFMLSAPGTYEFRLFRDINSWDPLATSNTVTLESQ